MNDSYNQVLDELKVILGKIKDNKVYGSVELYFEEGEITQITQRIINKLKKPTKKRETDQLLTRHSFKKDVVQTTHINLE